MSPFFTLTTREGTEKYGDAVTKENDLTTVLTVYTTPLNVSTKYCLLEKFCTIIL